MTNCTVCKHPQREAVETAIRGKSSLRQIATLFSVSKDSVRRHRKHMPADIDLLRAEIPACPIHGSGPFRFEGSQWVCGKCSPWDGTLTYWKFSSETVAQEDDAENT